MDDSTTDGGWLAQVKGRDLDGALDLALNALAPLGPLGAQLLYVAQPLLGMIGGSMWRDAAAGIAEALEAPGGVEALKAQLEDMRDESGA